MKKLILSLFSLFSVFAGVPHCLGNPAPEEVRASQPNRERRHGAYSKDNWTVYYEGRKVKGASASSFTDLGGGYGKDDWTVFYRGRKVEGASASSFESLGNGMGKDNWHTYQYGVGRKAGRRLLEGQLDGVLPRPEGGRGVGDDLREPRERIRKGCLEGILQGRSGEGRLGTDVRRTRGRIRERRMESLLPGKRAAGGVARFVRGAARQLVRNGRHRYNGSALPNGKALFLFPAG